MTDRQPEIDLICEWMGWKRSEYSITSSAPLQTASDIGSKVWHWRDQEWGFAAPCTFDPFTNPADCARVMDEVYERGFYYKGHSPFMDGGPFQGGLTPKGVTGWNGRPDYPGEGATETEAKMNAVLALIRAGKGE